MKIYSDFIRAFAIEIGASNDDAEEQWAGFSRGLSDKQRDEIESQGWYSGIDQGKEFAKLYSA